MNKQVIDMTDMTVVAVKLICNGQSVQLDHQCDMCEPKDPVFTFFFDPRDEPSETKDSFDPRDEPSETKDSFDPRDEPSETKDS